MNPAEMTTADLLAWFKAEPRDGFTFDSTTDDPPTVHFRDAEGYMAGFANPTLYGACRLAYATLAGTNETFAQISASVPPLTQGEPQP